MIKLNELRYKSRSDTKAFAATLDISKTTLSRIEAAIGRGEKHQVNRETAFRLVEALKVMLGNENLVLEDVAGVEIAPPRTGRPKTLQGAT